ncbi:adenosine receptor A1-like [Antedon mediterranea]|uniref:adenosine receptor A1-like n=1 Tax=Antedon mediterranea TaxID=105859 RepID=UPI003AF9BB5C
MDTVLTGTNITTDDMRENLIVVLSVYIPLDVVIITGNALVLFFFRQTRHFEDPQFVLLASLAFVDLLTGIIAVPMFMWGHISTRRSLYLPSKCHIQYIPSKIFISISFCHLLLITVDRYVSIMKPLHYHKLITLRRIYFSIAFSWILGCFYGTMPFFGETKTIEGIFLCYLPSRHAFIAQGYVTLAMVSIGTLLLIIMYFRIVLEARKHNANIESISLSTRKIVRKRFKAAKTSALIVCAFGITFLPHALKPVVYSGYQRSDMYWYILIAEALVNTSSAVNPFIYVCRLRQFSYALSRLFNKTSTRATKSTSGTSC